MSKKGLGKGLGALIPEVDVGEDDRIQEIEVARIKANPRQPRKHFDQDKLAELAQSIREHGLVQPLVLRPHGDAFELVAGERRWRAAQLAGLEHVPAVVREFTDAKMMEIALIENLQRENLNPIEEAQAYRVLLEEYRLTQDELARRLGKSRPQITNTLRLLGLDTAVQEEIATGRLSMGHAKVLLALEDGTAQRHWAAQVVRDGLSVRQLEQVLQQESKTRPARTKKAGARVPADLMMVENQLRELLGAPVKIHPGKPRGRVEISFFGEPDLMRIVEILFGRTADEQIPAKRPFHI